MIGYYYLHTNGDLIYKPAIVVELDSSYFDSDFVKKYWCFDSEDRNDAWTIILEALILGANINRIKELSSKWGLTLKNFHEFMIRTPEPNDLLKQGIILFATEVLEYSLDLITNKFWEILERAKNENHTITN